MRPNLALELHPGLIFISKLYRRQLIRRKVNRFLFESFKAVRAIEESENDNIDYSNRPAIIAVVHVVTFSVRRCPTGGGYRAIADHRWV